MSPIVSVPLTFPHVELPELLEPPALPNLLQPLTSSLPPKPSCSAVPQACHSDHAYQPSEVVKVSADNSSCLLHVPSRKPWVGAKSAGKKVYGMGPVVLSLLLEESLLAVPGLSQCVMATAWPSSHS